MTPDLATDADDEKSDRNSRWQLKNCTGRLSLKVSLSWRIIRRIFSAYDDPGFERAHFGADAAGGESL